MKKFFLTTCLIIMASLAFSQGYFSEKEVKDLGLEVKYDKFGDRYTYQLKGKNKNDSYGGQNEHFNFKISYDAKDQEAYLVVTFRYEGSNYINISRAQVYIDGQTMDFRPDSEVFKNKIEYPKKWMYYEYYFEYLYTDNKQDLNTLIFLVELEDAKDVSIRLYGKTGYEQYKLTKKEIEASTKILNIFIDKEIPQD